jgi:hypothetical protein
MTEEEVPEQRRVYINEAEGILNRKMDTLRRWEQVLPEDLKPKRGKRNARYWSPEQIESIRLWMISTDRRPGKGLPSLANNDSDEAMIQRIIAMRKPRGPSYTKNKRKS